MTEELLAKAERIRAHKNAHHYQPAVWNRGAVVRVYLRTPPRPLERSKLVRGAYVGITAGWSRPRKALGHVAVSTAGCKLVLEADAATDVDRELLTRLLKDIEPETPRKS